MRKGFLLLLFVACLISASPGFAEEPLFLLSTPASSCAAMSTPAAPVVPDLTPPQPESRVIVCGTCGDVACDFKQAYGSCTVFGWPGVCEPGLYCSGQTPKVECYCREI